MTPKFHSPFSPLIMETEAPKKFVDKINDTADKVLGSDAASVEWDWSHTVSYTHLTLPTIYSV